jgi:hypothetical protein
MDSLTRFYQRERPSQPYPKCREVKQMNLRITKNKPRFKEQSEHPSRNSTFNMDVQEQIKTYIDSQPEAKRDEMQELHTLILAALPGCKQWFDDGKNADNKTVSNPNVGYGQYTIKYANGKTREFFRIGMSANTTGISVYILGLEDKKYLAQTYGKEIGKASVTGYCIKFNHLKDINVDVLIAAIRYGVGATGEK